MEGFDAPGVNTGLIIPNYAVGQKRCLTLAFNSFSSAGFLSCLMSSAAQSIGSSSQRDVAVGMGLCLHPTDPRVKPPTRATAAVIGGPLTNAV